MNKLLKTALLTLTLAATVLLAPQPAAARCDLFQNHAWPFTGNVVASEHGRQNCKAAGYVSAWDVPLYHSYRIVTDAWEPMHDAFWRTEPVWTTIHKKKTASNHCNAVAGGRTSVAATTTISDTVTVSTTVTLNVGLQAKLNEIFKSLPAIQVSAGYSAGTTNTSTQSSSYSFSDSDMVNVSGCKYTVTTFETMSLRNGLAVTNLVENKRFQFKCYEDNSFFASVTPWMEDTLSGPICDFRMREATATYDKIDLSNVMTFTTPDEHECGSGDVVDIFNTPSTADDVTVPDLGPACQMPEPDDMPGMDDASLDTASTDTFDDAADAAISGLDEGSADEGAEADAGYDSESYAYDYDDTSDSSEEDDWSADAAFFLYDYDWSLYY